MQPAMGNEAHFYGASDDDDDDDDEAMHYMMNGRLMCDVM